MRMSFVLFCFVCFAIRCALCVSIDLRRFFFFSLVCYAVGRCERLQRGGEGGAGTK